MMIRPTEKEFPSILSTALYSHMIPDGWAKGIVTALVTKGFLRPIKFDEPIQQVSIQHQNKSRTFNHVTNAYVLTRDGFRSMMTLTSSRRSVNSGISFVRTDFEQVDIARATIREDRLSGVNGEKIQQLIDWCFKHDVCLVSTQRRIGRDKFVHVVFEKDHEILFNLKWC